MDNFIGYLNLACLVTQGALQISFSGKVTGKQVKTPQFALYIGLLCITEWISIKNALPWLLAIGLEVLALYGVNRLLLKNGPAVSLTAAILAVYISQLSFGLVNSIEMILFPSFVGKPFIYVLALAASAVSLGICAVCYMAVVKSISLREDIEKAGCLLFPALFFFAAELYIMQTSYTQTSSTPVSLEEAGKQTALLALQALGLGALLCSLYAYRRLCRSVRIQTELQSLTQAVQAQKAYIAEARRRETQTRAFRHDISNHLSVLHGLLQQGKLEEGSAYLQTLKAASQSLAPPYQTGNPVVDVLLGEKLGILEGVETEVSLRLPEPCGIDAFDLCVIVANALDNAIRACQDAEGPKYIRVRGERQGDFYLLAFENTCAEGPLPPAGTGLSNIRAVAEKYHGAMLAEKTGALFSLNVLLNIS